MTVADDAPLESTYASQTFRFCSPGCKAKFDKEPDRYATATAGASPRESRP